MNFLNHSLKLVFIAFIASLCALTACEGPEGPQGPSGSDGADGAQGAQGVQGVQGPQGPAGTSGNNGSKSYTFSLSAADYTNKIATVAMPAITQSIYDNGVVLTYWKANLGWRLLPFVFIDGTTSRSVVSMFDVGEMNIQVFSTMSGDATVYSGSFRTMVIPGTPGKKAINLDYSDYEAVATYYDLPLD